MEKVRIAILGSCATRDSFNSKFNKNYKEYYELVAFGNQTSVISLMSDPVSYSKQKIDNLNEHAIKEVEMEIEKTFLQKLIKEKPDYLILDFFADIHFGVLKLGENKYLTNNRWKILLTTFYKELNETKVIEKIQIQDDYETYFSIWKDCMDKFLGIVKKECPDTQIIVHKARNVENYMDKNGNKKTLSKIVDVSKMNNIWNYLDDYVIHNYSASFISLHEKKYTSFEEHPWGKFHVHYTLDYYNDFLNKLNQLAKPKHQAKMYSYNFSIIMAVYNVEKYLEEAIDSVVKQSLLFEKHVQLILVNDGSLDDSETVCLKYKEKYPNNIIYIKKENGGVSSARNEGLKHVDGKYVNFLDPDDKLSETTFQEVLVFFEKHHDEIDVVSIPMVFFEAAKGHHILNNKFDNNSRIINLLEEHDKIQLSASSAFIKTEELNNYYFNEDMKYAEDAELLNRIMLNKCALGVVANVRYFYRKRFDESSAIQNGAAKYEWYSQYLDTFSTRIIQYSLIKKGFVPKYIQYMVMYDIQWRLNTDMFDKVLDRQEQVIFKEKLTNILNYIDDDIILAQRNLNIHRKIFALSLKRLRERQKSPWLLFLKDDILFGPNINLIHSLKEQSITIDIMKIVGSMLIIEGNFGSLLHKDDIEIIAKVEGEMFSVERVKRPTNILYSLGEIVKDYYGFKVKLPLVHKKKVQYVQFLIKFQEYKIPVKLMFNRNSKINPEIDDSYYSHDKFIVSYSNNELIIVKNKFMSKLKKEIRVLRSLFSSRGIGAKKAILARTIYHMVNFFYRNRTIWIMLDRLEKADDNAEHFFKYCIEQKDKVKKYFVLDKNSKDFKRLKKIGPVVAYGSYKHKLLHLLSDKIISSHANEYVYNPFFTLEKYYRDLMNYDYVFLQHGITKDDLSNWLNKYNKNINLFITAARLEYNSIIEGNYNYTKDEVRLTGFPRYDNLINNDKKQILIMPTWRRSIVNHLDPQTGVIPYNEEFKKSKYFKMYNRLINDKLLLSKAKEKGYKIVFVPHPNIAQQLSDFDKNDEVLFPDYYKSYQTFFNECSMLVTDYSSVAFDVAYLKKPIVYFQFDENHIDEGYFEYKSMGFGEVCTDYETLLQSLIRIIDRDCKMEDMYIERVENFYGYTDSNNCKRVYKEIIDG